MRLLKRLKEIISCRSLGKEITYEEARNIINKYPEAKLVDVRSIQEYREGHLSGAICVPVYDINKITDIIKNRDNIIILYCQCGARSKKAAKMLSNLCYNNVYIIKKGLDC